MRYTLLLIITACSLQSFGQANTKTYSNNTYQELKTNLWKIQTSAEELPVKRKKTFNTIAEIFGKYLADERNYSFMLEAVNLSLPQIDSLIGLLDTAIYKSEYRSYASFIRSRIAVAEAGKIFPSLSLKDSTGGSLAIDSLRGKIVLIDVWSSGCVPCRAQMPGLRKLYSNYHPKGFEVIGVSFDKERDPWLKAIKKDQQPWANFCELVPWPQNTFSQRFYIQSIPANYLLDKDGTIIGIDLSEEEIGRVLNNQL